MAANNLSELDKARWGRFMAKNPKFAAAVEAAEAAYDRSVLAWEAKPSKHTGARMIEAASLWVDAGGGRRACDYWLASLWMVAEAAGGVK